MDRIALFGCGQIGKYVQDMFPEEMIKCFIDNKATDRVINGVPVISYDQFREDDQDSIVVISTKLEYAEDIAAQLEKDKINDYLFWEELFTKYERTHKDNVELFRRRFPQRDYEKKLVLVRDLLDRILIMDKESEVEFYFVDYFELSHYLPIYNALKEKGIRVAMVAEPKILNTKKAFNYRDTIELLSDHGIPYYTLANPDARIAVTTQFAANLSHYRNKKCHVAYGVGFTEGKSFIFDPETAEAFDIVMVQGEFYKERLTQNGFSGKLVSISYPRYVSFFSAIPTSESIRDKLNIKTEKPIVAYLPTYDAGASIKKYSDSIDRLRDEYYIITKPHHCTFYREENKEDLETLYRISDKVVHALSPISDIAVVSDLAVCDARSAVLNEVSFLNKSIKPVALMTDPKLDRFYIDINEFVDCVYSPDSLKEHLDALRACDPFSDKRRKYIDYFYDHDVKGGIERAVNAIVSELYES